MIEKTRVIKENFEFVGELPTYEYENPKNIYLALTNARCAKYELYVKEGDSVKYGQLIGKRDGGFFEQPFHSTVSGTVVGIEKHFHRSGKLKEFIKIENDFKHESDSSIIETPYKEAIEMARNSKDTFVEKIKNAGLVGLGGSGFPTYIKLKTDKKINSILVNGIECEPFLTSDVKVMETQPDRIIKALILSLEFFNAKEGIIVIKDKYKKAKVILEQVIKKYGDSRIRVHTVENYYPAGWEISMYKDVKKINIEAGKLPVEYGVIGFNASTMVGIYRSIVLGVPVTKRNFTLTGDGIKYPQNFRIIVGTPLIDLIKECGGYIDNSNKVIIMGGPMMGSSIVKDNIILTKTVTSVIVLNEKEIKEEPCIRCASCTYSCPVNINPVMIMNAVKSKNKDAIEHLGIKKCIECGMCSYTCTSKIHLTDYMRKAKKLVSN